MADLITRADIEALVAGVDVLADWRKTPEYRAWIMSLVQEVNAAAVKIEEQTYAQLRVTFGKPLDPVARKAAEEMWRNEARAQAKTFAVNLTGTELQKVGSTIAQGMVDGKGPRDIARRLEMVKGLDDARAKKLLSYADSLTSQGLKPEEIERRVARLHDQLLRDRRETIARTETAHAQEEARRQAALARGATHKTWIVTSDERTCDICPGNGAVGAIPIAQTFPSGDDRPPQHPNCRCALAYTTEAA